MEFNETNETDNVHVSPMHQLPDVAEPHLISTQILSCNISKQKNRH